MVTYYADWKRNQKDASWDRVARLNAQKWTISNPVSQRAMIGMAGPQDRQFFCNAPEKLQSFAYGLYNSSGQRVTDSNGKGYLWLQGYTGSNALYYENLPKGTYQLRILSSPSPNQKGAMPFGVTSYGLSQQIAIQ